MRKRAKVAEDIVEARHIVDIVAPWLKCVQSINHCFDWIVGHDVKLPDSRISQQQRIYFTGIACEVGPFLEYKCSYLMSAIVHARSPRRGSQRPPCTSMTRHLQLGRR